MDVYLNDKLVEDVISIEVHPRFNRKGEQRWPNTILKTGRGTRWVRLRNINPREARLTYNDGRKKS